MSAPQDFLATMARSSRARSDAAEALFSAKTLQARIADMPQPPPLSLDGRFDLIAELKLRSPAMGLLSGSDAGLEQRVLAYGKAGAAMVSVLTEPARFDGSLEHLQRAARALAPIGVPAMRKDFLVDPYQVLEARAAGAGGVLLIVRMLEVAQLQRMMAVAAALGLFVLLETFDEQEVDVAAQLAHSWAGPSQTCLIGVNSRNLSTLQVVPERLERLVGSLPKGFPRVAESGLQTPADAQHMARCGYTLALVGTALMSSEDPALLVQQMIVQGRAAGIAT
jgi:indole-3-glycerol phosphate synthase